MWQLNLPSYKFTTKIEKDKIYIFDNQRKKYVRLNPEEWVRQNFIKFLIEEKSYHAGLIAIETQIIINGIRKRCDAIVYTQDKKPLIIIEFKSPEVEITQTTFDQVAVYNYKLNVDRFILSNGIQHYYCALDINNKKYQITSNIPDYKDI